ncbi:MAG: pantoate--beta-alanine ligase [Deltaproteobacteria bacterium]|nr:pantoate--beta-alanine ligase [Deltaproteobacteria bacterium]
MEIIKEVTLMQARSKAAKAEGQKVVFVPTMGFLHDGHRELIKTGRKAAGKDGLLVLSIFVNPAQFGPKEDLSTYPRDMDRDLKMAGEEGVDAVFTPGVDDVYPRGFETFVEVTELQKHLCGERRPGHFRGVATVVLKLFNMVMPDSAVFGKKDYQQLKIIERMARDLNLGVDIIGVDTVRESDGLAMSSRNAYLSEPERRAARSIPGSLKAASDGVATGVRQARDLIEIMKKIIEKEPVAVIEYIRVCDKESLEDLDTIEDEALVALAVSIGRARLIDNRIVSIRLRA